MKLCNKSAAVVLAATVLAIVGSTAAVSPIPAQSPSASSTSRAPSLRNQNVVVLDPAHGGSDAGATVGTHVLEKDVVLAMAAKLRGSLAAAGFNVASTRDRDTTDVLTPDQRAEAANRARAAACIILHATGSGSGIHLYTSMLQPAAAGETPGATGAVPWDSAQSSWVEQSVALASDLQSAFVAAGMPVLTGRATLSPLENLNCPAVAIELAPLGSGSGATPVNDAAYQQRLARAVASALSAFRTQQSPPQDTSGRLP